jgi:FkbM family methyltransferase
VTKPQSKRLSRPAQFALRTIIFSLIGVVVLWIGLYFFPGLAILPFVASVKHSSPFCSNWQTFQDAAIKVQQSAFENEIRAHTRLIRTEKGFNLWSTVKGEFWAPNSSDDIINVLLAQQKRKIYGDAASGGVKAGDIVLDGGAHVGSYVRTALDAGAAKVIAIEPSPEAVECLRRNFVREVASGRVIIYPKGIWDEEKRLVFYSNGNGAAGDSFVEHGRDFKIIGDIPVTTIDKIVAELALPRVDLIKADIKGAGTRMITGATKTIRQFHPRIVVSVEEGPEDPVSIKGAVMQIAPDYHFRCGPCMFSNDEIRNDTIFFQ